MEVYSHQLTEQICHFLAEKGVGVAVVAGVHPSRAEIVEKLSAKGFVVKVDAKLGVGRVGRDWGGRTVVGHMMPRHAVEYCTAGAQYYHFELPGRPAEKHNHSWSVHELQLFNATFVKYEVWRWGKSIRLFDSSSSELNI